MANLCGCEVHCAFLEHFDTMHREGKWIIFTANVAKGCKNILQWSLSVGEAVINWKWTIV